MIRDLGSEPNMLIWLTAMAQWSELWIVNGKVSHRFKSHYSLMWLNQRYCSPYEQDYQLVVLYLYVCIAFVDLTLERVHKWESFEICTCHKSKSILRCYCAGRYNPNLNELLPLWIGNQVTHGFKSHHILVWLFSAIFHPVKKINWQ